MEFSFLRTIGWPDSWWTVCYCNKTDLRLEYLPATMEYQFRHGQGEAVLTVPKVELVRDQESAARRFHDWLKQVHTYEAATGTEHRQIVQPQVFARWSRALVDAERRLVDQESRWPLAISVEKIDLAGAERGG